MPQNPTLLERLSVYYNRGWVYGKVLVGLSILDYLWWKLMEWVYPVEDVDMAVDFPYAEYADWRLREERLLRKQA